MVSKNTYHALIAVFIGLIGLKLLGVIGLGWDVVLIPIWGYAGCISHFVLLFLINNYIGNQNGSS